MSLDMSMLNGTARMAFMNGMQALQQRGNPTDRMLLAAKQGNASYNSFAQALSKSQQNVKATNRDYSVADKNIEAARQELSRISWNNTDEYMDHLKDKYGIVSVESVPRDQASLDKIGGTMRSGHDVVVSPIALEKMAGDPEKAAKIEGQIDYFLSNTDKYEAEAAAMGLTFESCGCVVHDDGTVTYICGGGDPPERVAEVDRINRKKREKEAEMRRVSAEKAQEAAQKRRELEQEETEKRRMFSQMMQYSSFSAVSASFDMGNVHIMARTTNVATMQTAFSSMF